MLRWAPIRAWSGSRHNPYGKCRLRKTVRGFLQYYGKYIQAEYPFSSWAPPTEEEGLQDTKTQKKLNKVWVNLMKALK